MEIELKMVGEINGFKYGFYRRLKYMKIYLPISADGNGGGSTFVAYLLQGMKKAGGYELSNMDEADVFFAIGAQTSLEDIPKIIDLKRKGMKILFRLDGILQTRMSNGVKRMKLMYEIADAVVCQSLYIREEVIKLFGERRNTYVIYNGVDTDKFNYSPIKKPKIDFLYCEYSHKPHKRAQEAFSILGQAFSKNPEKRATIIGKYSSEWVNNMFGLPQENIKYIQRISHDLMPAIMSEHKILLFPSENEPCSNLVLEAMASGMLVVHKDSGCMKELCGNCGIKWTRNLTCLKEADKDRYKGRLRVEKSFRIKDKIAQYLNLIGDLVNEN